MKYAVLAFFALFALINADDWQAPKPEDFPLIHKECNEQNPQSEENLAKLFGHFEFPNEPSVRKYLLCVVKKMGNFCEEHGFIAERFNKQFEIDKDEVTKHIENCNEKADKKTPVDEWAYHAHQCIFSEPIGEQMKEHILKNMKKREGY